MENYSVKSENKIIQLTIVLCFFLDFPHRSRTGCAWKRASKLIDKSYNRHRRPLQRVIENTFISSELVVLGNRIIMQKCVATIWNTLYNILLNKANASTEYEITYYRLQYYFSFTAITVQIFLRTLINGMKVIIHAKNVQKIHSVIEAMQSS